MYTFRHRPALTRLERMFLREHQRMCGSTHSIAQLGDRLGLSATEAFEVHDDLIEKGRLLESQMGLFPWSPVVCLTCR